METTSIDYYTGYAAGVRALADWLEHNAAGLRGAKNTSLKAITRLCACIATRPDMLMQRGVELAVYQQDTGKTRRYYLEDQRLVGSSDLPHK